MNLPAFNYARPATLAEAAQILRSTPEARPLAGGQTLIPALKQRLARPSLLVDLRAISELRGIAIGADAVTLAAMTTHAEVAGDPAIREAIPALAFLANGIAHPQVRHMGTIGGSISNNDPAADYPAALVGLGAEVETDQRRIPADAFFTGLFATALDRGEIVVRVRFPRPRRAGYCKIPSQASGYVIAGCFIADTAAGVRVAVNGAGPCVFRHPDFEAALAHNFGPESLKGLKQDPQGLNTDLHATAAYRAHLVSVAARRALAQAIATEERKAA